MGAATKAVRIYEADQRPIKLLAATENCTSADIVHNALAEYMERHKDRLARAFKEAQVALAAGDLEALGAVFAEGAEERAAADAARVRRLRKQA